MKLMACIASIIGSSRAFSTCWKLKGALGSAWAVECMAPKCFQTRQKDIEGRIELFAEVVRPTRAAKPCVSHVEQRLCFGHIARQLQDMTWPRYNVPIVCQGVSRQDKVVLQEQPCRATAAG